MATFERKADRLQVVAFGASERSADPCARNDQRDGALDERADALKFCAIAQNFPRMRALCLDVAQDCAQFAFWPETPNWAARYAAISHQGEIGTFTDDAGK